MKLNISRYLFCVVIFFALGGLVGGYLLTVIAGATPFLIKEFSLNTEQISTLIGLILFGGVFAKAVLIFNDFFGRKTMLYANLILFIIGIIIFTLSNSYTGLFIGRFIQGSGAIMSTVVFPVYLSEIAPSKKRGTFITVFQLSWTAGMLIAAIINLCFTGSGNWRIMFNLIIFIPIILIFFVHKLPISPRWLVLKGRLEEAKEVIVSLNSNMNAVEIQHEILSVSTGSSVQWKESFGLIIKYRKPILYAIAIFVLTQLCGVNAIMQTTVIILKNCGIQSNFMAVFGTILVASMNFIMTIGTILLVDKLGRKRILKIGINSFIICMIILAILVGTFNHSQLIGWLSLICIMLGVGFVAFGPAGVVYVLLAEVLPTPVRSIGFIIGGFASIITGTIFASKFLIIGNAFGYSFLFSMLAVFAFIYLIFSKLALPETSGKSLEEIEKEMSK